MSTAEILRVAHSTAAYLTLPPAELGGLYELSRKFIMSGAAVRQLTPSDLYSLFELQFYLCVLTGHDTEAATLLATLTDRFGHGSPRVAVLRGVYLEITEGPVKALEYLSSRPDYELAALKRRIAVLKSSGQTGAYVKDLLVVVETFPADAESWAELAAAYLDAGMFAQSLFALHEVLLLLPLAYNVNALVGETLVQQAASVPPAAAEEKLREAVKFFLRSVELCEDYVRGWCGVLVAAKRMGPKADAQYAKLSQVARAQLQRIVDTKDATEPDLKAAAHVLRHY